MSSRAQVNMVRDRFLVDVADHRILEASISGQHRHISFGRNDGTYNSFQITTWPDYLCITGVMGTFVFFSRSKDMLDFFGSDYVQPDYWAQYVKAIDIHGALRDRNLDLSYAFLWNCHAIHWGIAQLKKCAAEPARPTISIEHLLVVAEKHRWAILPQANGGWVIQGAVMYEDDGQDVELTRTRGSMALALWNAIENQLPREFEKILLLGSKPKA